MTFPGLEMTILKFHDFSRFSMTVWTLHTYDVIWSKWHPISQTQQQQHDSDTSLDKWAVASLTGAPAPPDPQTLS